MLVGNPSKVDLARESGEVRAFSHHEGVQPLVRALSTTVTGLIAAISSPGRLGASASPRCGSLRRTPNYNWILENTTRLRSLGFCRRRAVRIDLAPKFYPGLSSFGRLDVPIRAVVAAGAGAELST